MGPLSNLPLLTPPIVHLFLCALMYTTTFPKKRGTNKHTNFLHPPPSIVVTCIYIEYKRKVKVGLDKFIHPSAHYIKLLEVNFINLIQVFTWPKSKDYYILYTVHRFSYMNHLQCYTSPCPFMSFISSWEHGINVTQEYVHWHPTQAQLLENII